MISYIRHNSVFDLGSRTGVSTCKGLYAELDDIYSKYINPQVRVWYVTDGSTMDCLCNMAGKQVLANGTHAFIFQNGSISVTVDEQDNVTIADSGSGGGGGGLTSLDWADINSYSGTVDGNPFNSETDSLRIGDGLYEPFTYGFVDSLDAPFAMTSAYPPNPGETQSITITELPTFFETTENYSDTVPSGDFRLAMADKVIKVKKSQTDTELLMILIVGNFEIAYGGTN